MSLFSSWGRKSGSESVADSLSGEGAAPANSELLAAVSEARELYRGQPTLLDTAGLSNHTLNNKGELVVFCRAQGGRMVPAGMYCATGLYGGSERMLIPLDAGLVGDVWVRSIVRSSIQSPERICHVAAQELIEDNYPLVMSSTNVLAVAVIRESRAKDALAKEVTPQYIKDTYRIVLPAGTHAYVLHITTDISLSVAAKEIYDTIPEVNPIADDPNNTWAQVAWFEWWPSNDGGGFDSHLMIGAPGFTGAPTVNLTESVSVALNATLDSLHENLEDVGRVFLALANGKNAAESGIEYNLGGPLFQDGRFSRNPKSGVYSLPVIIRNPVENAGTFDLP